MKHLGDITKIDGTKAPVVDVVIGGSPCQDMSIAGKRAGLDGERSGLFMEQIRIIKEMRNEDERNGRAGVDVRPRYMVWENVCGALSSGKPKGEDFRIVLEEIAKVADKNAVIPRPDKGKWTTVGCIMGRGYSISWRVLDAQFWGVPQRRRRIALVADFGGQSASEILFVREGVSGHSEQGKSKGKEASTDVARGVGSDDCKCIAFEPGIASREGGHIYENVCGTLRANAGDNHPTVAYQPVVYDARGNGDGKTVCTITGDHCNRVTDYTPVIAIDQGGKSQANVQEDLSPTLTCTHGGEPAVCYWDGTQTAGTLTANNDSGQQRMPDKENFNCVIAKAVDCRNCTESDINNALLANAAHSLNGNNVVRCKYIVRRLTPMECERLQGYPDGWTDIREWVDSNGKKRQTSDASRYKALGNSIALPPWKWVLKRLCACYERDATMASLFDGIGGFPYLWEQLNGKGSCLWASEIEEFPMAVTKMRIGGD